MAAAAGDPESLPAVSAGRAVLDANRNGTVSTAELEGWLRQVRDSRVAITGLTVRVTHGGKPLADADVRLVPEACMGPGIKEAAGRTDASGGCALTIPGGSPPGVNCGLYRVSISGRGNDGRELASKYNSATTLGVAVGARLPENGTASFTLD
ncbi:MAG: hypothetical protein ACKONH_08850 [Planctomycetia bacterium]